jgi:hypothetical protein
VHGGYFCAAFAQDNRHFSPDHVSIQRQGGLARAHELKKKRLTIEAQQHSLLLPPDLFVKSPGTPMTPDEIREVTMTIKLFDNYLGRKSRTNSEFSLGIVQDAWRVLKNFGGRNQPCVQVAVFQARR